MHLGETPTKAKTKQETTPKSRFSKDIKKMRGDKPGRAPPGLEKTKRIKRQPRKKTEQKTDHQKALGTNQLKRKKTTKVREDHRNPNNQSSKAERKLPGSKKGPTFAAHEVFTSR